MKSLVFAGITLLILLGITAKANPQPVKFAPKSVRELSIGKELEPNFDQDLKQLASLESRFKEDLPLLIVKRSKSFDSSPSRRHPNPVNK